MLDEIKTRIYWHLARQVLYLINRVQYVLDIYTNWYWKIKYIYIIIWNFCKVHQHMRIAYETRRIRIFQTTKRYRRKRYYSFCVCKFLGDPFVLQGFAHNVSVGFSKRDTTLTSIKALLNTYYRNVNW